MIHQVAGRNFTSRAIHQLVAVVIALSILKVIQVQISNRIRGGHGAGRH